MPHIIEAGGSVPWQKFPVKVDRVNAIITICGVRYSFEVFALLGLGEIGSAYRLIERADGVVTVELLVPGSRVSALREAAQRCDECLSAVGVPCSCNPEGAA